MKLVCLIFRVRNFFKKWSKTKVCYMLVHLICLIVINIEGHLSKNGFSTSTYFPLDIEKALLYLLS